MKRPLRNMLSTAGADVASRVLGFAATAYLAQTLAPSAFGAMSIGLSVLSSIVVLASPGLHMKGIRDVAADPGELPDYAGSIVSLRLALSAALIVVTAVVCLLFVESYLTRTVVIGFSLSALPFALSLDWYLQGKEQLVAVSAGRVLMYVVYFVLAVLLVSDPQDVMWTAAAYGMANVSSAVLFIYMFRTRVGRLSVQVQTAEWKKLLKESLPFGVFAMLSQAIMNLPVLLVGLMLSSGEVGYFSAAMKLIFFALMLDRMLYALFYPVITRYRRSSDKKFSYLAGLAVRVTLLISIPTVVIGGMFASDIISLIFGSAYIQASGSLQLLLFYFVFTTLNTIFMCVLIADGREREFARIMTVGTVVLLALCVVLTSALGITGTSLSLAVGEGIMTLLLVMKVRETRLLGFLRNSLPALSAGAIMVGTMLVLKGAGAAVIPVAVLAFAGCLLAFGGLSGGDIRFLRERFV